MLERFEIVEALWKFLGKSGKQFLVLFFVVFVLFTSYFFPSFYKTVFTALFSAWADFRTEKMMMFISPMLDFFRNSYQGSK